MSLTKEKIEQLAPDQSSLAAALKLMKPASWPVLAREGALAWGECQGSGATPYRVVTSLDDLGYKCTCPSRKFPCKHALAVMWLACETPQRFAQAPPPPWVEDWLSRRRPKGAGSARSESVTAGASMAAAVAEAEEPKESDPKAEARAAAQRQRAREQREAAVLAGLDELDRWILDQLQSGLAGFAQQAGKGARALITRLVDAKAQALAGRVEALVADVHRLPEQMRGEVVLERLASLALISAAYRSQEQLPPALKADVRRAASWITTREELLEDPSAFRVSADWIVAATRSIVQPDRLRRLETWLLRTTPDEGTPAVALLIDFVPVTGGPSAPPFVPGETLSAEIVFYPSAAPLRGLLASRAPTTGAVTWPSFPAGLNAALARYRGALARQPWLESWPLGAGGIRVERLSDNQLALADPGGFVVPLERTQTEALTPMLGLEPVSALFTWDGRYATLLAAETPIGTWYESP